MSRFKSLTFAKCDVCSEGAFIETCKKCNRIRYCSKEQCSGYFNNGHKYICYTDLIDYIAAIIDLHKRGRCHNLQCKNNDIVLDSGLHFIKLHEEKIGIVLKLPNYMCVLCGDRINDYDYNNQTSILHRDGSYNIKYKRCYNCLQQNHYMCPLRLTSRLTCAMETKSILIYAFMVLNKKKDTVLEEIKYIIINYLLRLRCCYTGGLVGISSDDSCLKLELVYRITQ